MGGRVQRRSAEGNTEIGFMLIWTAATPALPTPCWGSAPKKDILGQCIPQRLHLPLRPPRLEAPGPHEGGLEGLNGDASRCAEQILGTMGNTGGADAIGVLGVVRSKS